MQTRSSQQGSTSTLLPIVAGGAALFIWLTGRDLPSVVAAHFNSAGMADGFMPRVPYLWLMLGCAVVLPLLAYIMPIRALKRPGARINLPNRGYWLAAPRREATIAAVAGLMANFSMMLMVFLCYIHWVVVKANLQHPPGLPAIWFVGGLGVFLAGAIAWSIVFIRQFQRIPGDD